MKKILFILLLISFWNIPNVSARWYGNHAVAFTNPGWTTLTPVSGWWPNRGTRCNSDGNTSWGSHPTLGEYAVANDNNSSTLIPETDAEFTVGASWNMRCLYWDASVPLVNTLTYTNAWTNNPNQTVNFSFTDAWGSRLSRYTLQQRIASNNPTFSIWGAWQNVTWHTNQPIAGGLNTFSSSYSFLATNNRAYQFQIRVEDVAWNISVWTTPARTIRVDTQAPVAGDIGNTLPADGSNNLAEASRIFSLTVWVNGWSPIVETRGYFEDRTTTNSYRASAYSSPSGNFSHAFDIRNVDLNRLGTWQRQYSLKITRVCDQAGNCTTIWNDSSNSVGIRNFTYNIYANTLDIVTNTVQTNPFSSSIVADGSIRNLVVRLRDRHNNIIIPASGVSRTISMSLNTDNNLRLDQYTNTSTAASTSAWYADNTNTGWIVLWSNTNTNLWNRSSGSGDYIIPFYVFAPTSLSSSLVPGSARLNNIRFSVAGTIGAVSNVTVGSSAISITASPLFTTNISGDIETQGFIEGVTQNSNLSVTKVNSTSVTSPNLYFEFWNYNTTTLQNEANQRFNLTINGSLSIREGWFGTSPASTSISGLALPASGTVSPAFPTRMLLQSGAVDTFTNSYLASIVRYQIWTPIKIVIYPADIIGKTSYHGVPGDNNSFQAGIKILGNTNSQNTQEITTDQFSGDVRILWSIEKSLARKDIQTQVYELIKNITLPTSWALTTDISSTLLNAPTWNDTTLRWKAFYSNSAIYFWTWVRLLGAGNISGNKTLVVEWNVYIDWNILDTDNNGMLGIIALSKNGVGGNIYIDPSVRDIHAILYADRSVLSYDGTKEFDGTNSSAAELANQLYIRGSVFSENTIGGSRKTPISCPYFVNVACTQDVAQKYDMNYLRRYFIYDSNLSGTIQPTIDSPANLGSRSQGGDIGTWYETYPVIIDYNSRIQQTPPPFFWGK